MSGAAIQINQVFANAFGPPETFGDMVFTKVLNGVELEQKR
jgi:hypothetical protein